MYEATILSFENLCGRIYIYILHLYIYIYCLLRMCAGSKSRAPLGNIVFGSTCVCVCVCVCV